MVHHADFAVPVPRPMHVQTRVPRPGGDGTVSGAALALGWWVDRPGEGPGGDEPTGTLYLVADEALHRPVWIAQADVVGFRLD